MSRRIDIDGKAYRRRRGRLVEIPPQWAGRVTHSQTIHKRPSKLPRKLRMHRETTGWPYPYSGSKHHIPGGHPRDAAPRHVGTKGVRKLGLEEL